MLTVKRFSRFQELYDFNFKLPYYNMSKTPEFSQ